MSRDEQIIARIASNLDRFEQINPDTARFVCPFCEHLSKHLRKHPRNPRRKAYLFQATDQRTIFKCHNCHVALTLKEFVGRVDPIAFDDIYQNQPAEEPHEEPAGEPVKQPPHVIRYQIVALTDLYSEIFRGLLTNLRWRFNALDPQDIEDLCSDAWLSVLKYIQQGRCKYVTEDLVWKSAYRLALEDAR